MLKGSQSRVPLKAEQASELYIEAPASEFRLSPSMLKHPAPAAAEALRHS